MNPTPWRRKDGSELTWRPDSLTFAELSVHENSCMSQSSLGGVSTSCISGMTQQFETSFGVSEQDCTSPGRNGGGSWGQECGTPPLTPEYSPWRCRTILLDRSPILAFGEFNQHYKQQFEVRPLGIKDNSTQGNNQYGNPKPPRFETDPVTLVRRQKQIDYGKKTAEYAAYLDQVPKESRLQSQPKTPDKSQKCSRRSFDGQIKLWRLLLHAYGTTDEKNTAHK